MEQVTSMYLHIPFCASICSYCDFAKMYYNEDLVLKYIEELTKEVNTEYKGETLKTLYVGGGTPSHLSKKALDNLFKLIDTFKFQENYEFTFECNIEDIDRELLIYLKEHRVNRLSVGVETFQEKFLKFLNRTHKKEEVKEKVHLIKEIGFANINIDLMYAFPNETLEDVKNDLEEALVLDVSHLSLYSLIIEDHTKLGITQVEPIDDDLDYKMYKEIEKTLETHGYSHYEISNYAKSGFEAIHNKVYWQNETYYGFGLGSSGYYNKVRYSNTRSINHYLEGKRRIEEEIITKDLEMSYEMILGLRLLDGVSLNKFKEKYGLPLGEVYAIMDLIDKHLLEEYQGNIRIPKEKMYLANQILIHFL